MISGFISRTVAAMAAVGLLFLPAIRATGQWAMPQPASANAIPAAQLIQPADLNRILRASGAGKPLILQVGSRIMFDQAHIPGSEYVGAGSQAEGVATLRGRVASLSRETFIVLYCGCCPWNRCPNVGPAYQLLRGMGFTHVKVLYLPGNFGDDWANKGFPVASGR
jgi:thiosulfate/3-mercaptopyruvate sulfurtransferase